MATGKHSVLKSDTVPGLKQVADGQIVYIRSTGQLMIRVDEKLFNISVTEV